MTSALQAVLSPAVLVVVVWEVTPHTVLVTPTTSRALRLMGSGPGIRTGCGQGVARLCASMPGASGGREPPNGPELESSGGSFTRAWSLVTSAGIVEPCTCMWPLSPGGSGTLQCGAQARGFLKEVSREQGSLLAGANTSLPRFKGRGHRSPPLNGRKVKTCS